MLTIERKSILNISASCVLASLGWWSFCNSFFFSAATVESAWFWHRLSSIGWCGFVTATVYYFTALTNIDKKTVAWWKKLLFIAPVLILILKNLFGTTTSLAQNIVKSTGGFGWTYENSVTSFWLWAYLLYVVIYFGIAFRLLYNWAKSAKHKLKREMAILFIILDTITVLCGVVTDVIMPLTTPVLPALASVATAIFGIGYFTVIYKYDLFNINLLISAEDILQINNNSIFVMDENREILKYNRAVERLLGYTKSELMGMDLMKLAYQEIDFTELYYGEDLIDIEARLRCKDGSVKDVLLSASAAKDKRNSFLCFIISCQDVSKQKKVQNELELEREKYKKLAKEYQQLAHFDQLTGLPNRRNLLNMLGNFEKEYRMHNKDFAVIFLDLDNFKIVNDVYGHKGGDELLVVAAQKLKSCVKSGEYVARLGGDEFMIIMPCSSQASDVQLKVKQIRDEFHISINFEKELYEIKISAGYAVFSQIGDLAKLMQIADKAMYWDKKGGALEYHN